MSGADNGGSEVPETEAAVEASDTPTTPSPEDSEGSSSSSSGSNAGGSAEGGDDKKGGSGSGGGGGKDDPVEAVEAPTDEATVSALYKQAATKFNIKQKDCIKFLIEKVGAPAVSHRGCLVSGTRPNQNLKRSTQSARPDGGAIVNAPLLKMNMHTPSTLPIRSNTSLMFFFACLL